MARKKYLMMDAEIFRKNFRGIENQYNRPGDMNFCMFVNPDDVDAMKEDGWNIKYFVNRNDPSDSRPFIQITVSFKNVAPKIYMRAEGGRAEALLSETGVGLLDTAEIVQVDVRVNGHEWDDHGRKRIKAYLDEMHVTIVQDEMDRKYSVIGEEDPPFDV